MAPSNSNGTPPLAKASQSSSNSGGLDPVKSAKLEASLALPTDLPVQVNLDEGVAPTGLFDDFKKRGNESTLRYLGRLCSEGHSVPDAFLTVAASQIGQIMLTTPNALWKAGLVPGGIFMFITTIFSLFTMYLMNCLYVEFKRGKINQGKWTKDRPVTQFHNVIGFLTNKHLAYVAQTFVVLQLLGTGIAQVIACAADWYSIEKSYSKRELQMIWGGILQLFAFFPTFKHFRVLNVLALVGTTMTAVWLLVEATDQGYSNMSAARLYPKPQPNGLITAPQYFFTGSAVLLNALGGHAIAMEMMDAMQSPRQYTYAYTGGWLWTIFLVIPHSIAINLAFPTSIGGADNVYQVVPMSKAKVASVSLMIVHQLAAFAYYVTPVFYIWEKFIGTHHSKWYIRLPSRLPVSLLIWLAAMAFPFYGAINSLMSAISVPFTAFAIPCLVYVYIYRTPESRAAAPLPPWKLLRLDNWRPMFIFCVTAAILYIGFGATAIAYSLKTIVDNSKQYGVFARCYQCPPNWESLLRNPSNQL